MPERAALADPGAHRPPRPPPDAVRSVVRATFNAAAPHFDAQPLCFWDALGGRTVELAALDVGMHVLDVCCGTGASAIPAARRVGSSGSVVGVDIADRLLALGRAKAHAAGLRHLRFVEGDMEHLAYIDASADAVLCVLGLYYAHDADRAVRRLWRAVRPGGVLAVTVWGRRSLEPAQSAYLETVAAELASVDPTAATPASRLGEATLLCETLGRACDTEPTVVEEVVTCACTPAQFWSVVLGSGYRVSLDAIGPEAAERVRIDLLKRLHRAQLTEVTSDVLYATVRKHP